MKFETKFLEELEAWQLLELSLGRKAMKNNWLYEEKMVDQGKVLKYKAMLVAKGFSHITGIDFQCFVASRDTQLSG